MQKWTFRKWRYVGQRNTPTQVDLAKIWAVLQSTNVGQVPACTSMQSFKLWALDQWEEVGD